MIQRIQSVYLLIAVLMGVLCLSMQIGTFVTGDVEVVREFNLWISDGSGRHSFNTWPLFAIMLLSSAISLYAIFMYRNRMLQARFCVFNVLLLVGWYILYAIYAHVLNVAPLAHISFHPSIPAAFPAISAILLMMARHKIMADEKLVRAADRIR
jgi:hypothetical protein